MPTRLLAAFVACVALAGCASTPAHRHPRGAVTAPSPASGAHPARSVASSGGYNRALATAEARTLLALGERVVPPHSHLLTSTPPGLSQPQVGVPSAATLVDRHRFYAVDLTLAASASWVDSHRPAGLHADGSSSSGGPGGVTGHGWAYVPASRSAAYQEPTLVVSVVSRSTGGTAWRVDGSAAWLDPRPLPDRTHGHPVHIDVHARCSASDSNFTDVTNPGDASARTALLPAGTPDSGLLCRYGTAAGPRDKLVAHRLLRGADAAALARTVRAVPLAHTGGAYHCPAGLGTVVVLVFGYPDGSSVDLWYANTGCSSLRNGTITSAPPEVAAAFAAAVEHALR